MAASYYFVEEYRPGALLDSCLRSALLQGKNVLRKEPMGKEVEEMDVFSVNDAFTSKFYKVKVGTISTQKDSEPEKLETRQKVEEDRKPQVRQVLGFRVQVMLTAPSCDDVDWDQDSMPLACASQCAGCRSGTCCGWR